MSGSEDEHPTPNDITRCLLDCGDRTLQPTALVHELYLQLPNVQHLDWQSRTQFLGVAAKMMRRILVDHAGKRQAAKRGGGALPVIVDPQAEDPALKSDVLVINEALDRMSTVSAAIAGGGAALLRRLDYRRKQRSVECNGSRMFAAHGGARLDVRTRVVKECHWTKLIPFGNG